MAKEHDEKLSSSASTSTADEQPSQVLVVNAKCPDKEAGASTKSDGQSVIRERSASRDSVTDDPRSSFVDSISATSVERHCNWSSGKDIADDYPSISSIRGDSISATIADYNRKHKAHHSQHPTASLDNQSRASCRLALEPSSTSNTKNDDSSVNLNYYAASGSSTSGGAAGGTNTADDHHYTHQHHRGRKHSKQRRSHRNNQQRQQHNSRNHSISSRHLSTLEQALGQTYDDLLTQGTIYQIEPIVIRGNGNLTLFGLSNSFNSEFPPALLGRVSREEFDRTISQINSLLSDQQSLSAKLLLFGSVFCCCSLGFSLVWPSIVLKRRSRTNLEKFLANENQRLYSKLGLNWQLGQRCFNRFVEHILIIEFNPKIDPYIPD